MVHLVMFLDSAIQAGTYIAAKRALGELSPFELALARFTLAGAVYAALLWRRRVRVARRDLLALAALGVIAIPLNQGCSWPGSLAPRQATPRSCTRSRPSSSSSWRGSGWASGPR